MDMEQRTTPQPEDLYAGDNSQVASVLSSDSVTWTASEYLDHQKSMSWYLTASGAILCISALSFILMRELFSPIAVLVLGTLLMVIAARKPRTLTYTVDAHGIVVGSREYTYEDFLSFSIIQEGPVESIMLLPQKRWSPALNLYFAPEDGQKIFDILSSFLPLEERSKDGIDRFLHKIRF